jgi:Uma2 family endonuclease
MRGVMTVVPEHILEWRKRTGMYQRDEVWEGVLHMSPEPDREHQDFEGGLETWLRMHWARPRSRKVYHRINLSLPGAGSGWIHNFRIPDLVLLTRDRFAIDHRTHFEGGPEVVVEIRSPDDESEEKLPFYAQIGVPEVWIIDRDTKAIDLHLRSGDSYMRSTARGEGWFFSPFTGIEMRVGRPGKLAIRLRTDEATRDELPED